MCLGSDGCVMGCSNSGGSGNGAWKGLVIGFELLMCYFGCLGCSGCDGEVVRL